MAFIEKKSVFQTGLFKTVFFANGNISKLCPFALSVFAVCATAYYYSKVRTLLCNTAIGRRDHVRLKKIGKCMLL